MDGGTLRMIVAMAAAVAIAWTVWLTRAVVRGGPPDTRARELEGVRPGEVERGPDTITAYHYRVSSRFGEYVQVRVVDGEVQLSGRRVSPGTYTFFIGLQALLMASVPVALVAGLVFASWAWVGVATVVFAAYAFASSAMAGGLWEGEGIGACQEPATFPRVAIPLESVDDVRIGAGWSRNRLGWVIWPFVKPIDRMAATHAVSFEAPDPVLGRRVVYAMHFYTATEASAFADVLRSRR